MGISVNTIDIVGCHYYGTTKQRGLMGVFFSIKNKKFIRPVNRTPGSNRVEGYYLYKIFPGIYILFDYWYWHSSSTLKISKVSVTSPDNPDPDVDSPNKLRAGDLTTLEKVTLKTEEARSKLLEISELKEFPGLIEIVRNFLDHIPGYHTGVDMYTLSNVIYDDTTVNGLLEFLKKYNNTTLYYPPVECE